MRLSTYSTEATRAFPSLRRSSNCVATVSPLASTAASPTRQFSRADSSEKSSDLDSSS